MEIKTTETLFDPKDFTISYANSEATYVEGDAEIFATFDKVQSGISSKSIIVRHAKDGCSSFVLLSPHEIPWLDAELPNTRGKHGFVIRTLSVSKTQFRAEGIGDFIRCVYELLVSKNIRCEFICTENANTHNLKTNSTDTVKVVDNSLMVFRETNKLFTFLGKPIRACYVTLSGYLHTWEVSTVIAASEKDCQLIVTPRLYTGKILDDGHMEVVGVSIPQNAIDVLESGPFHSLYPTIEQLPWKHKAGEGDVSVETKNNVVRSVLVGLEKDFSIVFYQNKDTHTIEDERVFAAYEEYAKQHKEHLDPYAILVWWNKEDNGGYVLLNPKQVIRTLTGDEFRSLEDPTSAYFTVHGFEVVAIERSDRNRAMFGGEFLNHVYQFIESTLGSCAFVASKNADLSVISHPNRDTISISPGSYLIVRVDGDTTSNPDGSRVNAWYVSVFHVGRNDIKMWNVVQCDELHHPEGFFIIEVDKGMLDENYKIVRSRKEIPEVVKSIIRNSPLKAILPVASDAVTEPKLVEEISDMEGKNETKPGIDMRYVEICDPRVLPFAVNAWKEMIDSGACVTTDYIIQPNSKYFIAEEDGEIVGMLSWVHIGNSTLYINLGCVRKDHRCSGLYTDLVKEFSSWAKHSGYETIVSTISAANKPMLAAARKQGRTITEFVRTEINL